MRESKYNSHCKKDIDMLNDAFSKAIEECNYHLYEFDLKEEGVLQSYAILNEDEEKLGDVTLVANSDGNFYIIITTPFYVHSILIYEANSDLMAYMIRNTMRCVDDFDESYDFFVKFFKYHDEFYDAKTFKKTLENAFDEAIYNIHVYDSVIEKNEA